jgi:hypothetical protein
MVGFIAYFAVGGLFTSYLAREDFTVGIEPPTTPFGNGYLSTITR